AHRLGRNWSPLPQTGPGIRRMRRHSGSLIAHCPLQLGLWPVVPRPATMPSSTYRVWIGTLACKPRFTSSLEFFDLGVLAKSSFHCLLQGVCLLRFKVLLETGSHLFIGDQLRFLTGVHARDAEGILGLDEVAHLSGLHRENDLFHGRGHAATMNRLVITHHDAPVIFGNFLRQYAEAFIVLGGLGLP